MMMHDRIKKIQFFLWFYVFHSKTFRKGWAYAKANPDPDNKPLMARWYAGYWYAWRNGYDAWHTRHCHKPYWITVKEIPHMADAQIPNPDLSFADRFRILFYSLESHITLLSRVFKTVGVDGNPLDYSILTSRGKIPIREIRSDDAIFEMSDKGNGLISETLTPEGYIQRLEGYLRFTEQHPLNPIAAYRKAHRIINGGGRRYITSDGESAWLLADVVTKENEIRYVLRIEDPGTIHPTGIGEIGIFDENGTRYTTDGTIDRGGAKIVRYYNTPESGAPIE